AVAGSVAGWGSCESPRGAVVGGCGGGGGVVSSALLLALLVTQSSHWRPEERAFVSDFSVVTAVAASPFTLYAATTHGLLIYDRRTQHWALPVTTLDGYPSERVRTALADPVDDAVWLGTSSGWARDDANIRRWDSGL